MILRAPSGARSRGERPVDRSAGGVELRLSRWVSTGGSMARSTSTTLPSSSADPGLSEAATRIIHTLLSRCDGSLALRLWNDVTHSFGQRVGQVAPSFTLVLRDPK